MENRPATSRKGGYAPDSLQTRCAATTTDYRKFRLADVFRRWLLLITRWQLTVMSLTSVQYTYLPGSHLTHGYLVQWTTQANFQNQMSRCRQSA